MEVIGVVASFIAIGQGLAAVPKIVSTIRSICKPGSELDALASDLSRLRAYFQHIKSDIDLFSDDSITPAPLTTPEPPYLQDARDRLTALLKELTEATDACIANKNNGRQKVLRHKWLWDKSKIIRLRNQCEQCWKDIEFYHRMFSRQTDHKQGQAIFAIYAQVNKRSTLAVAANSSSNGRDVCQYQPTENLLLPGTPKSTDDMKEVVPFSPASPEHYINMGSSNSVSSIPNQLSRATPRRRCGCGCHSRGEYYQSHRRNIFVTGWFSLLYDRKVPASSPTECRKCNYSGQRSSTELLIQLPSWLCKSVMLGIFSSGPKSGISISLRPIVIIDMSQYIWHYISEENVVRFSKEISTTHFSLEDVTLNGDSLFEAITRWAGSASIIQFCLREWPHLIQDTECGRKAAWYARQCLHTKGLTEDRRYWLTRVLQAYGEDDDDAELFGVFQLAMLNKHDELDRLLSEKPELVHVAAPTGDTLLHVACRYAATGTASLLIRHGAHPDTRGACGDTPLHVSMSAGTLECTQLLLDKGADAKVLDSLGASLLHWAARSRSSERNDIIRSLLAAGVPIETTDIMKSTMLHRFAGSTTGVRDVGLSRERLKLILDAGGGGLLEARDRWGKTPLLTAISNRNHNALYALLEAGAQVNTADDYGFNPLHYAAEWGTVKVMEVLKEVRVTDLDIRTTNLTRYAATPLRWFRWQLRRDPDFVSPRWERPGDQETKAFEELLRDVRDRAISIEIAKLEGIISKIETGELVPAKEELVRLTEAKWKARIDWEAETFRAIGLDVRAGRIDLAIESLREFIEESRKRLEVSPFDEEDDPWATTANKEYSDDSEEEEEEGKEESDDELGDGSKEEDEGDEEEEDDDYDNTDSSDEDSD